MIYPVLFVCGAAGYGLIEVIWRGYTHWTMLVVGGVAFSAVYFINEEMAGDSFLVRCIVSALTITLIEFLSGILINRWLKWNVWDYSTMPYNLMGQICPTYSFLWLLLCFALVPLCTAIRKI